MGSVAVRWRQGAALALVGVASLGGACRRADTPPSAVDASVPIVTASASASAAPRPAHADAGADAGAHAEAHGDAGAPSVASLCAAFVTRAQAELDEAGVGPNGEPFGAIRGAFKKPFCREIALGKPFRGDASWKRATVVRAGGGFVDAARLVVERPRGWVMTSLAWDDAGRSVRGTPEFEPLGLAGVEVKGDVLEVSVDGLAMVVSDASAKQVRARRVSRCTDDGVEIACTPLSSER